MPAPTMQIFTDGWSFLWIYADRRCLDYQEEVEPVLLPSRILAGGRIKRRSRMKRPRYVKNCPIPRRIHWAISTIALYSDAGIDGLSRESWCCGWRRASAGCLLGDGHMRDHPCRAVAAVFRSSPVESVCRLLCAVTRSGCLACGLSPVRWRDCMLWSSEP
jgi:hypothetical protein